MTTMKDFIAGMPKAELHLHIEGTIGPQQMLDFAARNGIAVPYASVDDVVAAQNYGNLEEFLDFYYAGLRVVVTEQDFYELTWTFMQRCRSENIVYVEISFDPQPHLSRGIAFEEFFNGIQRAREDGARELGVASNLILCINRDRDVDSALQVLDLARPFRDHIVGVGLDSAEKDNPPVKFKEVYRRARDDGYHLTAHCDVDQENSVRHIWQCLTELGVERIDHGVNSLEDPALVEELKRREICLTVCPTWRPSDPGPRRTERLRRMFDLGLRVTANTDDPGLFASGYLTNLLIGIQQASDYTEAEIARFMKNAFDGAWIEDDERGRFIERLDAYVKDAA